MPQVEEAAETEDSAATQKKHAAESKHAARDRRAAEMATAHDRTPVTKRKVEDGRGGEEGEIPLERKAEDVEMGEVVEGEAGEDLVGDEWEEVISGGKVLKMRKVEDTQL